MWRGRMPGGGGSLSRRKKEKKGNIVGVLRTWVGEVDEVEEGVGRGCEKIGRVSAPHG